jgi:hypothetical protein
MRIPTLKPTPIPTPTLQPAWQTIFLADRGCASLQQAPEALRPAQRAEEGEGRKKRGNASRFKFISMGIDL